MKVKIEALASSVKVSRRRDKPVTVVEGRDEKSSRFKAAQNS